MKIMSLNVNQFRVLRLSEGCWAKDIVVFVKKFLAEDKDNVVFLYEVPHYASSDNHYYGELELFNDFLREFPEFLREFPEDSNALHRYKVFYSDTRAYFCTLAIKNYKSQWELANPESAFSIIENGKKIFQNRFIELIYRDKDDNEKTLRVLGVHASLESPFLESLADYVDKVPLAEKSFSKFIVLGDLNCHKGKKSTHRDYLMKMESRLGDLIEDKTVTFFPGGTTIDHVLVSKTLKDRATAQAIPKVVLELSDHAVIIVDVDL